MVRRWEIGIGVFGLLFALFVVVVWLPNDIKGAFLETTRAGKPEPGDAFFPVLLGGFIGAIALVQLVSSVFSADRETCGNEYGRISAANVKFLLAVLAILMASMALMYWTGPFAVWLTGQDLTYRQLIDTAPYKYFGFAAGGFALTFTLITWAEARLRARSAIVSILLIVVLIVVFDVALTNVQLPPNADF